MLIPFSSNITSPMVPVIGSLIDTLGELQRKGKDILRWGTSPDVKDVWLALQCEIALEKFFWGRVHPWGMEHQTFLQLRQFAAILGPGHNAPSTSLTDQLGFLATEDWTESLGPNSSLPPFGIWTNHRIQVILFSHNFLCTERGGSSSHDKP